MNKPDRQMPSPVHLFGCQRCLPAFCAGEAGKQQNMDVNRFLKKIKRIIGSAVVVLNKEAGVDNPQL